MIDYFVEPKSRKDLRALANSVRHCFGLDQEKRVPVVEMLDILSLANENFNYEIVSDDALSANIHAETDVRTGVIMIKETVYNRACNGEGRDRMTIAHELGHFFTLCCCGFKLYRNFYGREVILFKQPEWQAKCFAGEFMIPKHLVSDLTPEEIAKDWT